MHRCSPLRELPFRLDESVRRLVEQVAEERLRFALREIPVTDDPMPGRLEVVPILVNGCLLPPFRLERFGVWVHEESLRVERLDGYVSDRRSINGRKDVSLVEDCVPDRAKSEDNHFSDRSATRLGCIRHAVGLVGIRFELPETRDRAAATAEEVQRSTLASVHEDYAVALNKLLVAMLTFTRVVEAAVGSPSVEVSMLLSDDWVCEQEHVCCLR